LRTASKRLGGISVLIFLAVGVGCSHAPSPAQLIGDYECPYPFGVEFLSLLPDGSYIQVVRVFRDADKIKHQGSWSYNSEKGELILNNPLIVVELEGSLNPEYRKPMRGIRVLGPQTQFGTTSIRIDPFKCNKIANPN
jgi:hypothetical protein